MAEGYIGEVLSTTPVGSGLSWGQFIDQPNAYTADRNIGATLLTIPFGQTVDALSYYLGEVTQVDAVMANGRKTFTLMPEGKKMPMTSEDQVAVSSLLENGPVASVHYRGGAFRRTNQLWEIDGTEGDLQITADGGYAQTFPLTLKGGRGKDKALAELEIPSEYSLAPSVDVFAQNLAEIYHHVYNDITKDTRLCPTFDDAIVRHRLLQAIETAAAKSLRQTL